METNNKTTQSEIEEARRDLPGAAVNAADENADNSELVKERTATLNNNPRNEGNPV
ncbi:MAG: hypothetical protein HDS69_10685 [Bacteroidales bacterium]|nr:hypothetical protein [Bacteroidales bacterium]MBD5230481.1 hypothetical protein [Bacteroidales bacterium]MBD5247623.1 hypothetical protein [Barnesiella sp.]MBD5258966.1 hypothetical protein [Barnesiella sp.]